MPRVPAAWVLLGGVAGVALGGGVARADPHWLDRTGREWKAMSAESRRAWMEGFLSGSAVANATAAGAADSAGLVSAMERMRKDGSFRFPFGPPVYGARLEDHYQWNNHLPEPVWYALWTVDGELRRQQQPAPR